MREELLKHYVTSAMQYTQIDEESFYRFFGGFIISRMVQVLGVYGRQGLGAGKTYFFDSIPAALKTLRNELQKPDLPITLHALRACVDELAQKVLRSTLP